GFKRFDLIAKCVKLHLMSEQQEKRLHQQIAVSKHQGTDVRAMLEMLADVIIQYGSDGRIIWCNQQLCSLMECEAEELVGKALPELGIDIPAPAGRGRKGSRAEGVVH